MVASPSDGKAEYTGRGRGVSIRQQSLSEQVTEFLYRELVQGRLRQGDRINEVMLARNLGISRNPVREGLKRLEERGFLVTVPHRGTFVRRFTLDDVDDVFEFRKAVETFALELALPRMTAGDLRRLEAAVDKMLAAVENDDPLGLVENDMLFHQCLVEIGGNRRAQRSFADLFSEVRMLIALVDHTFDTMHDAAADHLPILEALRSGDLNRSIGALHEHLNDAHQRLHLVFETQAKTEENG